MHGIQQLLLNLAQKRYPFEQAAQRIYQSFEKNGEGKTPLAAARVIARLSGLGRKYIYGTETDERMSLISKTIEKYGKESGHRPVNISLIIQDVQNQFESKEVAKTYVNAVIETMKRQRLIAIMEEKFIYLSAVFTK